MSKIKDMAAEIEELERCGEFLIGFAAVLKEMFSQTAPESEKKSEPKPTVTHAMVRELAVEITQTGKKSDVKNLIEKYGVKNITALAESDLESFYCDLTAIGGDDDAAE